MHEDNALGGPSIIKQPFSASENVVVVVVIVVVIVVVVVVVVVVDDNVLIVGDDYDDDDDDDDIVVVVVAAAAAAAAVVAVGLSDVSEPTLFPNAGLLSVGWRLHLRWKWLINSKCLFLVQFAFSLH